jgi:hypothetical protein
LDTFTLSLNNFLSTVLQNIPLPTLLSFDDEQVKLRAMADEIETLRSKAWESYAPNENHISSSRQIANSHVGDDALVDSLEVDTLLSLESPQPPSDDIQADNL